MEEHDMYVSTTSGALCTPTAEDVSMMLEIMSENRRLSVFDAVVYNLMMAGF